MFSFKKATSDKKRGWMYTDATHDLVVLRFLEAGNPQFNDDLALLLSSLTASGIHNPSILAVISVNFRYREGINTAVRRMEGQPRMVPLK